MSKYDLTIIAIIVSFLNDKGIRPEDYLNEEELEAYFDLLGQYDNQVDSNDIFNALMRHIRKLTERQGTQ